MEKKTLTAIVAVGLAAAISIPTIAFGNARRNVGNLQASQARETPYIARLTGPAELTTTTPTGDPDGVGAAAVSFDISSPTEAQVCWDLSYSGILTPPTASHIHRGVAGVAGPVVVPFAPLGATSATGCAPIDVLLATEITTTPSNFYVNVHTTDIPTGAMRGQLAIGPAPAGSMHFLPVPLRAYDSREHGAKIVAGENRTISLATAKDLAGVSFIGVPPGATAAIVTLTVTETTVSSAGGNGGFLKLYSAAAPVPATSSINWAGVDQNVAVSTQVAVDASGQVIVTAGANATHFVIDVIGYLY